MRRLALLLLMLAATLFLSTFLIKCSGNEAPAASISEGPGFDLNKLESSGPLPFPTDAPEKWLLAHIDVETTGLLPYYHEMIDLGLILTDLDGRFVDSFFVRIQPLHPDRLSPIAKEINAFDADTWQSQGALSPTKAVDSLIAFHQQAAGDKQVMMVAYNSHFDASFIDALFREAGHTWRELYYYFILDIPSMAWGLGFRNLRRPGVMDLYDIQPETSVPEDHTGISGARKNVEVYQALLRYRASLQQMQVTN